MPLQLPGPKPGVIEFVPESCGNRSLAEPAKVFLRAPTERVRREFALAAAEVNDHNKARELALRTFVDRVDGVVSQAGGDVVSADDLLEHAPIDLLNEVHFAIYRVLGFIEDEKKSSAESSASPPQATQVSIGTAGSASPLATPSSATASSQTRTPGSSTSPSA